ncbi:MULTISPECIES: hypothetical protein [Staphylococcus]|uniref:Uncharacterized protein n=1 Tax=Staphylococcus devriesei TaxID=586733 RepID=A0ABX5I383_9STAP|nr:MULTISPECIES: hypothetical protein [Staphylococcus]PTF14751.1 hypothetical protein BUY47_04870 [Staphylococcus devriesei]PTG36377.1 hypothetical protein BU624_09330 [Staphylococcus capitis]PTK61281.1 hypothetical protein BUZ36_08110 [Staphylococcus haemolyticus]PTL03041.1 hypothetical protein BUZ18_05025 [Staphylococcus haemolyticus]RIO88185.1 hypothetical protein BUZ39_11240 [Staphylococcus haemolyticus]
MNCFIQLKDGKYVDVKELTEIKYSYLHAEKVTSITEDNLDRLKISDDANYIFVGKTHVVVRGSDILFIQFM